MKKFLICVMCLLVSKLVESQKKVSVLEYKGVELMPIVKKKGKKPKNAKVNVEIYFLIYEEPNEYNSGKFIQFVKYIQSYKGKRIREVIYDTGVLPRNRSIADNQTINNVLKSYESITDFKKICCVLNRNTNNYSFRRNAKILQTEIDRLHPTIDVKGSFYNSVPEIEFLDYLHKNNISSNSIQELISLKKYADNKFGDRGKYEDQIAELSKKNKVLSKELVKWIPNYKSAYDNNYRISHASDQAKNGIKLISVFESYNYDSDLYDDYKIKKKKRRLLIKFPKAHNYEGEVYLKSVDSINKIHSNYLEVYKSSTKNPIPFKNIYINDYYNETMIYGLNGSLNNEFIVNGKVRNKTFSMPQTDLLRLQLNNNSLKKNNPGLDVEEKRFMNHYLKTEITSRKKSYQSYKQGLGKSIQAKIDQYERLKQESIKKNGFFLVTRDYKKNIKDRGLNTLLEYIYEGKFHKLRSYDWVNDGLLVQTLDQFMRKQYQQCGNNGLPQQKMTRIYNKECAEYLVKKRNGLEVSRTCVKYQKVPSNLFTSKINYNTYNKIESRFSKNEVKEFAKYISNRNSMNYLIRINLEIRNNLDKIFKLNKCKNKAVKRFEDNLIRYINDDEPLVIGKPHDYRKVNYRAKQDFYQFVEDLIKGSEYFEHALKYKKNSLTELKITNSQSKQVLIGKGYRGKPNKIVGKFKYFDSYKNESKASIEILFNKKGVIKCIYLWSITNANCSLPNRKVISDLKAGKYIIAR